MRIDNYGSTLTETSKRLNIGDVANAANHQNLFGVQKATTEDKATLSSNTSPDTDSIQLLTSTALVTSPSRAAKVEALKQAISSAQYKLDSAKIAEALVNAEI